MKKILIFLFVIAFTATPLFSYAEPVKSDITGNSPSADLKGTSPSSPGIPTLSNPLKKINGLTDLIERVVDLIVFIGVIVAVFMFIFVGFKFVWAQGKPEALKEARKWFLYVVIGTAILISAKVLVKVIQNTLVSAGIADPKIWSVPK